MPVGATVVFSGMLIIFRRARDGTASQTFPSPGRVKVRYWSERTTIWFTVRETPWRQCLRMSRHRNASLVQVSRLSAA
ncbi:hypothetical protein AQJ67_41955 [Streptomyces caeruleatus]|uniref:Uncharacterized protein n=1 Tax=Streptomyces caeruleatus TaxID=661399 RepID=A0A101TGM7_9ACTN|nr:hypothetical protein AQJ67_41955 [Streptomyces caeruleatus]